MEDEFKEYLYERALEFKIELSQEQLRLYLLYINELSAWNERINLTGIKTSKRIIDELLLDSLIPSQFIPDKGRMLDVGSGAGFPGIVLKIIQPELQAHLVEPKFKRVNFLKNIIRILGLKDIEVINARIEMDVKEIKNKKYHVITSRALADLTKIIEWCSSFLKDYGCLVGFLGMNHEAELEQSKSVIEKNYLKIDKIFPYTLPGKSTGRAIVVFTKMA